MIDRRLGERRNEGRAALIAYLTAGDPDAETSLELMHALVAGGVDAIELGYPFSDPILDGPVLQAANRRALAGGGSLGATLAQLARFRERDTATPVILMGYANPPFARGFARFADDLARAGGQGVIIADLPLRHARHDLLPDLARNRLVMVPLAAPTLAPADTVDDTPGLGGFLYAIPVTGPTGGAPAPIAATIAAVARARTLTVLPVGVGFGIRTPEAAAEVARVADAVIVGSALVERATAGAAALETYARAFRTAIDRARSTSTSAPSGARIAT